MKVQIITEPFTLEIFGFSSAAIDKDYARTAFKLMDRMWREVKPKNLKNKGNNIWVYEPNEMVFAGVELTVDPGVNSVLERKQISLEKYAYFKHVGAYNHIKQVGEAMTAEIHRKGFETTLPYIEIYGHWTQDESKLETELLMNLVY